LGILNVLLPIQVITGLLLWSAGHWPRVATAVGGSFQLATIHSLCSWLFAAFLVMHIYLTTTGHTPTSNMAAMINGWEEIEDHGESKEGEDA
jgi:thiosulfate reductase cytochrome b subunit